jgi:hypothetical protein
VLLESTPKGLDLTEVRAHLLDVAHVLAVHGRPLIEEPRQQFGRGWLSLLSGLLV